MSARRGCGLAVSVFDRIGARVLWCRWDVLQRLMDLSIEIAREGREGRRIGTLFTLGEADLVLARSRPLILDPLAGHAPARTSIFDENLRGTVKELAQLDGAFVVDADGTVRSACRYLDVAVEDVGLRLGLGSRHLAAASVSKQIRMTRLGHQRHSLFLFHSVGNFTMPIWPAGRF
jgi:DNA integrity scanning protein DisA with diadenylate cyclase activity